VLESNKHPYKNAVRLYKMCRRANKFSNRILDTPKLHDKPQDCTQPRSVSTSVDNAALSTLQSRLVRLEHHLRCEQSSAIAGTSREAPVASLIDFCPPDQPHSCAAIAGAVRTTLMGGCTSENYSHDEHVCKAGYQDDSCHEGF